MDLESSGEVGLAERWGLRLTVLAQPTSAGKIMAAKARVPNRKQIIMFPLLEFKTQGYDLEKAKPLPGGSFSV
jgi:hypothetical protein